MNEPARRKITFPRRSINHCLLVLGADPSEVYAEKSLRWYRNNTPAGTTLLQRFTRQELFEWGQRLYKSAIWAAHPDRGGSELEARAINQALAALKQMCKMR